MRTETERRKRKADAACIRKLVETHFPCDKPAAAGIVLGLAGTLFTCRVLESLLFGVKPIDA